MAKKIPPTDVLLTLMGPPHADDIVLSTLRLAQALLEQDARVQVWTCGYATLLTQEQLGDSKPRNIVSWSTEYPSMLAIIRDLLATFPEQLYWYGCRACSADRGADRHIDGVQVRPSHAFGQHVASAGKTIFLGVM